MARRLPDDPVKRRLQWFKRTYQHLEHFQCLLESGSMPMPGIITTPEGEEIYLSDLMSGIEDLPPRQREAFTLICLQGYTETAATKVMLPNSRWSTPVQQYADTALARMVAAYDKKQQGIWALLEDQKVEKEPVPKKRRIVAKAPSVSEVLHEHLQTALDELLSRRRQINAEITTIQQLINAGKLVEAT
jgi:DNA-directed RNA polymerase specialized sigma24 family protein